MYFGSIVKIMDIWSLSKNPYILNDNYNNKMAFKIFLNPPGELERGFERFKGQDSHGLSFPT